LLATLALSLNARMQRDFTNPSYIFLYFWCYFPWQPPSKMH